MRAPFTLQQRPAWGIPQVCSAYATARLTTRLAVGCLVPSVWERKLTPAGMGGT